MKRGGGAIVLFAFRRGRDGMLRDYWGFVFCFGGDW